MTSLAPGVTRDRSERKRACWYVTSALMWLLLGNPLFALPISYRQVGVPDFGQFSDPAWGNCSCGPTAAADGVWWWGTNGFPDLLQGGVWGNRTDANHLIGDLMIDMHSSPVFGTTYDNLVHGLRDYFGRYYPDQFHVEILFASSFGGGEPFWQRLKQELSSQSTVMPLVVWANGYGHAISLVEYYDDPSIVGDERVGMNDPASRGVTHQWEGEYLPVNIVGYTEDGITLAPWSSGSGYIRAAVVAHLVPEPTGGMLLLAGVTICLTVCRRRR